MKIKKTLKDISIFFFVLIGTMGVIFAVEPWKKAIYLLLFASFFREACLREEIKDE